MTTCRSCGASIVWAVTETGRSMPVDVEPTRLGNLVLFQTESGWAVVVRGPYGGDDLRHRPHFATCPDAESWRKR